MDRNLPDYGTIHDTRDGLRNARSNYKKGICLFNSPKAKAKPNAKWPLLPEYQLLSECQGQH